MKLYQKIVGGKGNSTLSSLLVLGVVSLMLGCVSIKHSGVKSGKNLYETFFVGDEGTQYFIKPITFNGENKNRLVVDFTFRYKDKIKDSAIVNMSFINTEIVRDIDSLKITNGLTSVVLNNIKTLFAERYQKEYKSRFSTKGSLADLNKLFDKNDWTITAYKQSTSSNYTTPKDTKKKINKLKDGIFVLF